MQASITPHLAKAFGLAARVQGLERYYALLLSDYNTVRLIKRLDGETVLAEQEFPWEFGQPHDFQLASMRNRIAASMDGTFLFEITDEDCSLASGGIALVCEEGRIGTEAVSVRPNPGT